MTFRLVIVCFLFAWSAVARAQIALPQAVDPAKAWAEMQQRLREQFDANRDGKLTGQEQLLAQEALRRQGINVPLAPGGFAGADEFNKQFDRDRDGKLSPQEKMAAQAAYQRMRNSSGGGVSSGGPLPQQPAVDPNASADQKTNKVPPLIKRFDKDGDGKLNAQEKEDAQAELKKTKSKAGKDKDAKDKAEAKKELKDKDDKRDKGK